MKPFYCNYCDSKTPCSAYNWGIECEEEIKFKKAMQDLKFKRRYYVGKNYVMFSLYCEEGTTEKGELKMQNTSEGLRLESYDDSFYLLSEFKDVFYSNLEGVSIEEFINILELQGFTKLYN